LIQSLLSQPIYLQAKINGQKDSIRSTSAKAYWKNGMLWVEANMGGYNLYFYLKSIKDDPNSANTNNMSIGELSSANVVDLASKNEYNTSVSTTSNGSFTILTFDTKDSTISGSWSLKAEALSDPKLQFIAKEGVFSSIKIKGHDKSSRVGEMNGKIANLTYKFPVFEAKIGTDKISCSSVGPDIRRGYWVIDFKKDLSTGTYKFDNGKTFSATYVDYTGENFPLVSGDMVLIENNSTGKSAELLLNGILQSSKAKKLDLSSFNAKFKFK
jgi:Family of unknown function (DUF6252)